MLICILAGIGTAGVPAGSLVVNAADLALEFVEGLVDRDDLVCRTFFGAEDVAPGADGDLRSRGVGTDPVVEGAQLELGVDDPIDHPVEPRRPPVDELAQAVVDPDAIAADLNLH